MPKHTDPAGKDKHTWKAPEQHVQPSDTNRPSTNEAKWHQPAIKHIHLLQPTPSVVEQWWRRDRGGQVTHTHTHTCPRKDNKFSFTSCCIIQTVSASVPNSHILAPWKLLFQKKGIERTLGMSYQHDFLLFSEYCRATPTIPNRIPSDRGVNPCD